MNHLLHPDLFETPFMPGRGVANTLNQRAAESLVYRDAAPITVAIRALNEEAELDALLGDIDAQNFGNEVEVVVVDNESRDRTAQVAKSAGATVVSLARNDFTYPRSMNLAMEAASHDIVFLTVGHALLTTDRQLAGGVKHFEDPAVKGAFSWALPGHNASKTERLISVGNRFLLSERSMKRAGQGVMAATGAMFSKAVWEELGRFDERFEAGGEDGAMARQILQHGYKIIDEPLLGVHHTHGLNPLKTAQQWISWRVNMSPKPLDIEKLADRRPDLDLS